MITVYYKKLALPNNISVATWRILLYYDNADKAFI